MPCQSSDLRRIRRGGRRGGRRDSDPVNLQDSEGWGLTESNNGVKKKILAWQPVELQQHCGSLPERLSATAPPCS
eukprot:754343-Hanusia_phi.AAC.1